MLNFAIKGTELRAAVSASGRTDLQSLSPRLMRLLRQESLLTLAKKAETLEIKSWCRRGKLTTMQREWLQSQTFRPEKCFLESCLAASRARLQTSLALSIRSQRAKRRNRYYNRKSRIAAMIQLLLLEVNKNGKINYCRIY